MRVYEVDSLAKDLELQIPAQKTADVGLIALPWWIAFSVIQLVALCQVEVIIIPVETWLIAFAALVLNLPLAIGLRRAAVWANALSVILIMALWALFGYLLWQYWGIWEQFIAFFSTKAWISFFIVAGFWTALLIWLSSIYYRALISASRQDKRLLSNAPRITNLHSLPVFLSFPNHLMSLTLWRRLVIIVMAGLSTSYYGMFLDLMSEGYNNPRVLLQQTIGSPACSNLPPAERLECGAIIMEGFGVQLVQAGIFQILVIFIGINIPGFIARWLSRVGFISALARIEHQPILFLRPFTADRRAIPSGFTTLASYVFNFGRTFAHTFESLIVEELQFRGPVIAIGDPGKKAISRGALREYFDGRDWQDAVAEQIANSQLVVLIFEDREAIWWELGKIAELGATDKLIIIFWQPPEDEVISRILMKLNISNRPDSIDLQRLLGWRPGRSGGTSVAAHRNLLTHSASLRMLLTHSSD